MYHEHQNKGHQILYVYIYIYIYPILYNTNTDTGSNCKIMVISIVTIIRIRCPWFPETPRWAVARRMICRVPEKSDEHHALPFRHAPIWINWEDLWSPRKTQNMCIDNHLHLVGGLEHEFYFSICHHPNKPPTRHVSTIYSRIQRSQVLLLSHTSATSPENPPVMFKSGCHGLQGPNRLESSWKTWWQSATYHNNHVIRCRFLWW